MYRVHAYGCIIIIFILGISSWYINIRPCSILIHKYKYTSGQALCVTSLKPKFSETVKTAQNLAKKNFTHEERYSEKQSCTKRVGDSKRHSKRKL